MLSSIRFFDGTYGQGEKTIRKRCKTCGERECPNAPVEKIGSANRGLVYRGGYMTTPVKGTSE